VATDPSALLSRVAATLNPRAGDLAGLLLARILDEQPELSGDGPLVDSLAASVQDNVSTVLRVFQMRPARDSVTAPAAALDYARRLAQRGVPISVLLRAYRLGQAAFHQAMLAEISTLGIDADTVAVAASELSTVTFDYVDRISEDVVAAYQQERDNWMRNRIAARSARVMAMLNSAQVDVSDVEKTLGYPLGQTHIGIVAWSADPSVGVDHLTRLERVVASLAATAGCLRPPLFVAPDDSTVWAWLARTSTDALDVSLAEVQDGVYVALGDPAAGVDGFRLTHRQARRAQVVVLAADPSRREQVTAWREVGAIALMCDDPESLASWVQYTLGGRPGWGEGLARRSRLGSGFSCRRHLRAGTSGMRGVTTICRGLLGKGSIAGYVSRSRSAA
jgi:DNA-binding PucR family transcriptional regulator